MQIFLIGFMGSGKSYWAGKLSKEMGIPWLDLDREIERKQGRTIREIFSAQGEEYFRQLEADMLRSVSRDRHEGTTRFSSIVATGGGAPCFHDNMEWMNQHGITVWLNPSIDELEARLRPERAHRPLLQSLSDNGLKDFIKSKIDERQEFYSMAKLELKNTNIAVPAFINLILHAQKPD
ncbi:shikimate kinase [Pollutibacter soli]|uniref:shikimate kinase n=1 Tax=Pollutibacter soli TaxID=3034157 RepID=UPI003013EC57